MVHPLPEGEGRGEGELCVGPSRLVPLSRSPGFPVSLAFQAFTRTSITIFSQSNPAHDQAAI